MIEVAISGLHLFHRLFAYTDSQSQSPPFDLTTALNEGSRSYIGLESEFIICMSRLGYADAPYWLKREDQWLLEDIQGMSFIFSRPADCSFDRRAVADQ